MLKTYPTLQEHWFLVTYMRLMLGMLWQKSILLCSCFWMPPLLLTPRPKNHISDRNVNSCFRWPFCWYSSQIPFHRSLFWRESPCGRGSVLSESGLSQKAGRSWHLQQCRKKVQYSIPCSYQQEARSKLTGWVSGTTKERGTNFVINTDSLPTGKLYNMSH